MPGKIGRNMIDPECYPEYERRQYHVTTRKALRGKVQFVSFRSFSRNDEGHAYKFRKEMDLYVNELDFGKVLWINNDFFKIKNYKEIIDEIKKRGYYLFDIWGYVPGSYDPLLSWGQVTPSMEQDEYIKTTLGDHFIGYDNGEQDGRYIGGYAESICPAETDRRRHYLNFQKFFEKLGDDLGNMTAALCSLNYVHYFAKEQNVVMLGAETAQGLPNANLWYSYLRGAGKQYGILWFGNTSVFNRYSWKAYDDLDKQEGSYTCGPDVGTSLSLLRRLLYQEYMYNSDILGYESFIAMKGKDGRQTVSPIGRIQHDLMDLADMLGYPGEMYVPVGILMDFYNGWTFPRHLYTNGTFMVWGGSPYKAGDYQTHALFSMIYPGYEDSGFFLDERGFLVPTPFGDIADVIFSDIRGNQLDMYKTIILAGGFDLDYELYMKLKGFVERGGRLAATLGQLMLNHDIEKTDPGFWEFFGISGPGTLKTAEDGSIVRTLFDGEAAEEKAFEYYDIALSANTEMTAVLDNVNPLVTEAKRGEGSVCLFAVPFGINKKPLAVAFTNAPETSISAAYDHLGFVRKTMTRILMNERIIAVSEPELGYSVNITGENSIYVTVTNNGDTDIMFDLEPIRGRIENVKELSIGSAPVDTVGYRPYGYVPGGGKGSGEYFIQAGDIKIYRIGLCSTGLILDDIIVPEDSSKGKYISVGEKSAKEAILYDPTLRNNFEGIKMDAQAIHDASTEKIKREAPYLKRRFTDVIVDFSRVIDHYPDISLLRNVPGMNEKSMVFAEDVMWKASILGCTKAVMILQRNAENHVKNEDALIQFTDTIRFFAGIAEKYGITIYIQNGAKIRMLASLKDTAGFVANLGCRNVKLAFNPAHSMIVGESPVKAAEEYKDEISAVLLCAPRKDIYGQYFDSHMPLHNSEFKDDITRSLELSGDVDFVCLDVNYINPNDAYADRELLL